MMELAKGRKHSRCPETSYSGFKTRTWANDPDLPPIWLYSIASHLGYEAPPTHVFIVILPIPSSLYPISLISFCMLIEKPGRGDARHRSIDQLLCWLTSAATLIHWVTLPGLIFRAARHLAEIEKTA